MNEDKNLNPGKIIAAAGAFWESFALQAAVKLDIFTLIGEERLTGAEVARKVEGDPRGVSTLLNALTAMGLLEKSGEAFCNTPLSGKYLSKGSKSYLGYIIMHFYHLADSWHHLDEAVIGGRPTRKRAAIRGEKEREAFLMGMFTVAMAQAPHATKQIKLTDSKHLLDLGGGPGTWAIHFCLQNPGLRATLYDLPTTRPFAERTIARFGLSDRIRFLAGDYLKEDIGSGYDAAWLSQILHGEGPDTCRDLIGKAVDALAPGGLLLIHEFILNNDLAGPLQPALFSLNMLAGTPSGRSYSEQQIMDMLSAAGAKEIRRLPFQAPGGTGIIAGTK